MFHVYQNDRRHHYRNHYRKYNHNKRNNHSNYNNRIALGIVQGFGVPGL